MEGSFISQSLRDCRDFFDAGHTRSYQFRREQLSKLKQLLLDNEKEINEALYSDLKKNPEEIWVTETGQVVAEISRALKKLKKWMKPRKVPTNLLNFPGRSEIHYDPLGVVLIIGPWNYPLQLLLMPLVGAMAAGNCAILKPSELAPATSLLIKKLVEENFPAAYLQVMEGEGAELVPALLEEFRFDHIFYTGSTGVGRSIYQLAASKLVPVTLELGGKSPCIVDQDADPGLAARRIAITRFSNAGQMCLSPDYVLVHEKIKDEFLNQLTSYLVKFFGEDPSSDYHYARIINEKHFHRLTGFLKDGDLVHGGNHDVSKLYIEPTILTNIKPGASIMQEEIFGPILPVLEFSDFDEALALIRKHPVPLAAYAFSRNTRNARAWLSSIPAGGGCINNASWHFTNPKLPFGGRGNSGMGAYHGEFSFETFSHKRSLLISGSWPDPALRYPPFRGKLKWLKKIIR